MAKTYLSVEVGKPANEHESAPRRNYRARKAAWTTPAGKPHVTTIYELLKEAVKEFSSKNCMGQRKFIKMHTETKEITKKVDGKDVKVPKEWNYYEMGPYSFISFTKVDEIVLTLGSALINLGFVPGQDKFNIFCRTSCEWMQTALACASQSVAIVTSYDTLGVEGLKSSLGQTDAKAVLTDKDNFGVLLKTIPDTPTVKTIVYRDTDGDLNEKDKAALKKLQEYAKVLSFTEFLELGATNPAKPHPPKPEDLAFIMYTSGSTGLPKGVMLNHSTVIAGMTGATGNITREIVGPGDVFLNILPLAHILEFTAELGSFYWGSCLGYGNPKTLSEASMRNCKSDIRELRPTVMAAVPAVWEAVRKGILGRVEKRPATAQKIFWAAFHYKAKMKAWGLPAFGVDSLVFSQIKEATGGRLRLVMNGGASLSEATRIFLNVCVAPCVMGYGLTETNANGAIMTPQHLDYDSTGELMTTVTAKLVDVADAGYFAKNGQGELLLSGASVSPGYWKNEEENKAAYTDDGWYKTGDIAEWTENGSLRIIDRKKNLIKTLNGEYIAIERLESLYRGNKYIQNICVFANDQHVKPVAVIVPLEASVKDLAESLDVSYEDSTVHTNQKMHNTILESIRESGREAGLKGAEILGEITFSKDEWTPQNGFVSSAQKLQRRLIQQANKEGIEKAFVSC